MSPGWDLAAGLAGRWLNDRAGEITGSIDMVVTGKRGDSMEET